MMTIRPIGAVLALATCAAHAQPIYRCGDGYSQTPCAGGTVVAAEPAPSAQQRRAAIASTQRVARVADEMERARLKQEAQPASAYVPPPRQDATVDVRPVAAKPGGRKPEVFSAAVPGSKPPARPADASQAKGKKKGKGAGQDPGPQAAGPRPATPGAMSVAR